MEEKDYQAFISRIDQIDRILKEPVESLVRAVGEGIRKTNREKKGAKWRRPLDVPSSVAETHNIDSPTQLNTALCCSTLQRLWRMRRRFPGLKKAMAQLEKDLKTERPKDSEVLELLAEPFLSVTSDNPKEEREYASSIYNPDAGYMDPYTASQVFWVLLNAGEKNAHSETGFLAFFCVLSALLRKLPEPGGVSLGEDSSSSAYVTAKCLAPLFTLTQICGRRERLLKEVHDNIYRLETLMNNDDEKVRRRGMPFLLEELSSTLYELATIAISRRGFEDCAGKVETLSAGFSRDSSTEDTWHNTLQYISQAFHALGKTADDVLKDTEPVLERFIPKVCEILKSATTEANQEKIANDLKALGLCVKQPNFYNPADRERFWRDRSEAAEAARRICKGAFETLKSTGRECLKLEIPEETGPVTDRQHIDNFLTLLLGELSPSKKQRVGGLIEKLAGANAEVAATIGGAMQNAVHWCEDAVTKEITHASAGNLTEFDPADLISGLFVTVSSRKIDSPLRVSDAINKALTGVRPDGSWVPGQPFFITSDMGLWAPTSDIVWMLSSTIAQHKEIRVADKDLGAYVDWLERTRRTLSQRIAPLGRQDFTGWVSERNLRPKRIDFWATTFAINALLGIRDLMEHRLWELCEKRFTVLDGGGRRLKDVDGVDLGSIHRYRVHRQLSRMARQATGEEYAKAEYSLVLHGPPGSSKTAIAQALANEMWRSSQSRGQKPRMVRITPADFTRLGESRLDSEARIIFDVLGRVRAVTILFDEIDDLLRVRKGSSTLSFMQLVTPAMLNRLQDLRDACPKQEICFILATNYVDRIEPALIRKGRIDRPIPIVYPDRESRRAILDRHIRELVKRGSGDQDWIRWATRVLRTELEEARLKRTDYWPWKAFETLCEEIIEGLWSIWKEPSSDHEKEKTTQAVAHLEEVLRENESATPKMTYEKRRLGLKRCAELREEFFQYELAGQEDPAEFYERLQILLAETPSQELDGWEPVLVTEDGKNRWGKQFAELLEKWFGDSVNTSLSRVVASRGWKSIL